MIYKFVKWEVPELDTLKDSKVFKLHELLTNGVKINQAHKDELYEMFRSSMTGGAIAKLGGYAFDFTKWTHLYYVEQYGSVYKRYAFNKTSIRKCEHGRLTRIVEVK